MDIKSVLFVGVGGDGIITVSNVVAEACMLAGFDVKKSEIHGMSQRGGSVSASVRFGKKVYSPTDKLGDVKFMIATEKIEALRWAQYLSKEAVVIINDRIVPIINQIIDEDDINKKIEMLNANKILNRRFLDDAKKLGNEKVANTVMLGVMSTFLPIENRFFLEAIDVIVPSKIKDINKKAFELGIDIAKEL